MKKIIVSVCVCGIVLSSGMVYALTEENYKCIASENEVCFAEDLMKEVVKQTIYTVGSHVLNKYMNDNNSNKINPYNYQEKNVLNNNTQEVIQSNTNTNTNANTNVNDTSNEVIPGYENEEEMIIIQ